MGTDKRKKQKSAASSKEGREKVDEMGRDLGGDIICFC